MILFCGATAASAQASPNLFGPVYPLPAAHGGPNTWTQNPQPTNNHTATDSPSGTCRTSPPAGTPACGEDWQFSGIDTSKSAALYWGHGNASTSSGLVQPVVLGFDCTSGPASCPTADKLTLSPDVGSGGMSDFANGRVVWTGTTTMSACSPAPCGTFIAHTFHTRFTLLIADSGGTPIALQQPSGMPGDVGALAPVPAGGSYKANLLFSAYDDAAAHTYTAALDLFNSYSHPSTAGGAYASSFDGSFYYNDLPPNPSFTVDNQNPQVGQTITLTDTSNDPDGSIASQGWDFTGSGTYTDASGSPVQTSFSTPGAHTVSLKVTDNEGSVATTSKTINVQPAGGGGGSGGGGGAGGGGGGGGSSTPPTASVLGSTVSGTSIILKIACQSPSGAPCSLAATLTTTEHLIGTKLASISRKKKKPKPTTRTVTVGQASTSIPAGQTQTIRVPLNGTGNSLLSRFHRLPAKLTVTLTTSAGTQTIISNGVVFKAPSPKKKKKKK